MVCRRWSLRRSGVERALVEAEDVLQESGGAGDAAPVDRRGGACAVVGVRGPVVGGDVSVDEFLTFERQLRLGQRGHRGGLLQKNA